MIYSVFIFILVLIVLVMIHELGHFVAAKLSKMRVEEFAFGFPPKLFSKKKGETTYAFNLLPIGGYVKITGESFDPEEREKLKKDPKAFQNRPRILQLFVLFAGVFMNMVLALFIFIFLNTKLNLLPDSEEYAKYVTNPKVYVGSVLDKSPSQLAGLKEGYEIVSAKSGSDIADLSDVQNIIDLVKRHPEEYISIEYKNKSGEVNSADIKPNYNDDKTKKTIGLALVRGQYVKLSFVDTIKYGFVDTYRYTKITAQGLGQVLSKVIRGESVRDSLAGPVGIAKLVGKASETGVDSVLFLTAILSINLAIFNILPIPALDGGRILFVLYEMITRKNISYNIQYYANAAGFLLLMALMAITVYFDIMRQF